MGEFKNVPAVEKAIKILNYYATTTTPYIGVTEIANALSISKGTVYSILNTMVNYDYIVKSRISGNYALGPGIAQLGSVYERYDAVIESFKEIINQYRFNIRETALCTVLEREMVRVLHSATPSSTFLKVNIPTGTVLSPLDSSAGKVLLSRFDDNAVDRVFDIHIASARKKQIIKKEDFVKSVRFVRHHGYCFEENEFGEQVYGFAIPMRNSTGNIVAAISISVPPNRLTPELKEKYIQILLKISQEYKIPY